MNLALLLYAFLAAFFVLGFALGWFSKRSVLSLAASVAAVTFAIFGALNLTDTDSPIGLGERIGAIALSTASLAIAVAIGVVSARFLKRRL